MTRSAAMWFALAVDSPANYAASPLLIEGSYEYFKVLDNNLADVMNKNITAEEATKRIEASWNKITEKSGRSVRSRSGARGSRAASISTSSEHAPCTSVVNLAGRGRSSWP